VQWPSLPLALRIVADIQTVDGVHHRPLWWIARRCKLWWLSCSPADCRRWSRNASVSYDGRCHGYRGTSMRHMHMDSLDGHGCRPTQFRIVASDIVGRFHTPHARRVPKISRPGHFKRFQKRQISSQARIEGCIASRASFLDRCFQFWCICCRSNLIRASWRCCVPRPTFITQGPCVVGKAPTFGDERPGCVPSARWTIRLHCDSGRAFGLVNTFVILSWTSRLG